MSRLSMSSISSNGSNGSVHTLQTNLCLICQKDSAQYALYSRPTIGSSAPFFPILESLSNSTSSQVNCCRFCSQSLLEQWNQYEGKQIAIKNRNYYLNNKTMVGSNDLNVNKQMDVNKSMSSNTKNPNTSEDVLDLSVASGSTQSKPNSRNDSNTVKYWTPNRYPQTCYICGEECISLVNVLVRQMANCPYFPSLMSHPKPNGANPVDSNGRIGACETCHRFLIQQWEHFQRSNIPIADRHYSLRPSIQSSDNRQRIHRYSCVLCNIELSHSMQNVVTISMLTMSDPNNSMKKLILSSAQEFIISSGVSLENGRVLTCINCFRDLIKSNDNQQQSQQQLTSHYSQNDSKKSSRTIPEFNCNDQDFCALCNRTKIQFFLIETNSPQISHERKPFFPFLKDLVKSNEIDSSGRVKVCSICLSSLESQWEAFEAALIPHTQRDYRLLSRRSPHRPISPPPLKIQVSSPPPLQQSFISEPLLTTVMTQTHNIYCTTTSTIQYTNEIETKISGPMDEMLTALGGPPVTPSANCVVCGEYSIAGHNYELQSSPKVSHILSHELGIYPFFPFLKKLISHNSDEENRNSGLVCNFCYHSLIGQWIAYNASPYTEDKDPMRRTYNVKDYICYICGITTFRQRVRSITVKDFPFLLEHTRPPGALTLSNGESVLTCLTCFDSLTHQWRDYERMKVPIEMRKYNWIIVPPPNTDSTPNETSLAHNLNESASSTSGTTSSSILLGLGSHHKPPVLNSSQISTTKSPSGVQRSMATVSPLYQVSAPPPSGVVPPVPVTCHNVMSNSALAATRTSSFAAALRKLAKQSIDPMISCDNGQQLSSLGLSVSHSSNVSKNSNTSSYQSPYQSAIVAASPPIVTIAPIPAHQIDRGLDVRKAENSFYDHRMHSNDQSKESILYSHSQQRTSPIVHVRPSPSRDHNENGQSSNHSTQSNVQNRSSGFQPYRTGYEENLRSNSSSSLNSTPLPSHLLPYETLNYPYHPFLPHTTPMSGSSAPLSHHVAHPSYRLEDHFYLDRFNLLRGSLHGGQALSHPASGGASSVPFNLTRYSELLNSQHERILNDERQRLLSQTLSQSAYKSGAQSMDSPPHHLNIPTTNTERLIENNSDPHLMNHLNNSLLNNSTKREFMVNSSSGSILSGTPREHIQSNSVRKQSGPTISASIKPLNLSSNSDHMINNLDHHYLWRPQTDENRDHIPSETIQSHKQYEQSIDAINRKNNTYIEESINAKNYRINNFEKNDSSIENRGNDKVIAITKFLPSDKNEGLHSRILENSEKSLVNDERSSMPTNHWQSTNYRSDNIIRTQKSPPVLKEIEEQVISKLDLEERNLKEKRLKNSIENEFSSDDDEDHEDSDDNDEEITAKYKIVLTRRLPLELDTNPEKMQFLRMFSLTTHKRKSQLEFNKFIKRKKLLRELSPEPCLNSDSSFEDNKENPLIFIPSDIFPDSLASEERSLEVKKNFMSNIGLREQICKDKQRDTELLWDGIIRDRELRIKREKCWAKLFNNLNKETLHKWLNNLQISSNLYDIDISGHQLPNGFVQNGFANHKYSNNVNTSRAQRKVILFNKHNNEMKTSLSIESRSQTHSNSSKDFAQEFHESVLLQTTKQQQAKHDHQIKANEQQKYYADFSSSNYKWPGIESVMEAYERYSCDRSQEKEFLQERTHQLKNRLQDINREAEYLSQKMADLIHVKTQLDDERERHQTALDTLKKCLKQLR